MPHSTQGNLPLPAAFSGALPKRRRCGAEKVLADFRVRQNHVRRFLRDHVDRRDDEEAGDFREDGGVDDAQAVGADDAEVALDDGFGVAVSRSTSSRRGTYRRQVLRLQLEHAERVV